MKYCIYMYIYIQLFYSFYADIVFRIILRMLINYDVIAEEYCYL